MAENRISYINRNYDDYRKSIIDLTRKYYPDVFANMNDASIGAWLIEVLSDIGDNLNYHIDKTFQETSIDSASEPSSIRDIARTNGYKIPYKKAALVEVEISCVLPLKNEYSAAGDLMADEKYAPTIRRGTQFTNGMNTFELLTDVDFTEQFNEDGFTDRQRIPNRNSNGSIISYTYKKLAVASASETKVMKYILNNSNIKPFMEVMVNDENVLGVESILIKQGTNLNTNPQLYEYYVDDEQFFDTNARPVQRYFEVDSLIDQYRFGYETEKKENGVAIGFEEDSNGVKHWNFYNPTWEIAEYAELEDGTTVPLKRCVRGEWKRLKNKFTTEYTDDWHLKIIFGAGIRNQYGDIPENAQDFTKYQMSRMSTNDYMGVLPDTECTMYVLYRVGGGEISNVAANSITSISSLLFNIQGNCDDVDNDFKLRDVQDSITVNNPTPSYGGKDEPSTEEIKYMIKYNNGSQNRCVTINDYIARLNDIPAKYGLPFRYGIVEENNKIVIYCLGLNYLGQLTDELCEPVAENMKQYLSKYKMINDFVEIKSGKIMNIAFEASVYIDKTYDKAEVTKRIIDLIYDYMDIRRHQMGEDIYIGDLEKEISKLDGVTNLIGLSCFNRVGGEYSDEVTTQPLVRVNECSYTYDEENDVTDEIDLEASDYTLFTEVNSMYEIKYKNRDITVVVKTRK